MSKIKITLITMLCVAAFTACEAKSTNTSSDGNSLSTIEGTAAEATETTIPSDEKETIIDTTDETIATASEISSKFETQAEATSETVTEETADDNGFSKYQELNLEKTASEQFQKSCDMQWKYLINCPYELDYEDSVGEEGNAAYRVIEADLNDILSDYNTVFISSITENGETYPGDRSAEVLQQKYRISQYATYCSDSGRGKNKLYKSTDFEFISYENDILKLNAISYYDSSDGETVTKENPFTMIYSDGQWKTWDFTLPY